MTCSHALLVFIFVTARVDCFNLENRDPIVKRGVADTYFGFSVALHKSEISSDIKHSWLLVGAPLGKNLQPNTNFSGALFKCPLDDFKSQTDCIQVPTDGNRPRGFDYEDDDEEKIPVKLRPPGNDEIKDGQWMGVNVRSQGAGGKVMVCAHRYIWSENLDSNQYGLGLCYSLNSHLAWEDKWDPCMGRPMLQEHQQFGYCQVGTSLALLNDGTAVIGSPGPFTWRGTIFVTEIAGEFLQRNKNVYIGPLNDRPEPINKYSYLGMSVAAGRFFDNHNRSYAAGAPRADDHGKVFIFNKNTTKKSELELVVEFAIDGKQFASNFGYEILAADYNNDGYDDLLISSPFYFQDLVGGSVYIYYNVRKCNWTTCDNDAVLQGKLESQFGISLANLGDINRDGYNDLAVGAPYEGYGMIYIYLGGKDGLSTTPSQKLHGWENAYTLGYSLSGGMDMDNNGYPDLLAGAYGSDAVVLFRTRAIIDIKTEVTGKELKNINTAYLGCEVDPDSQDKCFTFRACFTITSAKSGIDEVIVRCHIKEVLERGISRVWFKHDDDENIKRNYQTRYFTLQHDKDEYCQQETVYFPNTTRDILTPIKFRLNYTISNNIPHSAILNQTSIKDFAATFQKNCGGDDICQSKIIMNASLLLNETDDGKFILNLGDLEEFHLEINVTNEGDPAYEAKVFVFHPLAVRYIDIVNKSRSFKCSKRNDTVVSCDLGNPLRANRSLALQLRFETSEAHNQSKTSSDDEFQFIVFTNSTSEELSNQTKSVLNALISRKAEVKISSSYFTKTVVYSGEVKGEKAMRTFDDVGSVVWHSYQIQQLGPMAYADIRVTVSWPWQVGNDKPNGKWLLYLEEVNITDGRDKDYCYVEPDNAINILNLEKMSTDPIPVPIYNRSSSYENKSETRVKTFESTEDHLTNSFSSFDTQENEVDDGSSFISRLIRRRRETDYVVPTTIVTGKDNKQRKVVTMDCKEHTAKCIKIHCIFPKYPKGRLSTISIKSRLWNSTFVEDYSQVDWVRILSYGSIGIEDPDIHQHERSIPVMLIETNAYPDLSIQLDTGVPLWIIILAVVAGLVLLILLIFVLWVLGFFKRNRIKDPTLSGNLTKQSEQETLLNK
ncbi:integrin alpha-PS1 isoform X2 [Photinus pyralis]|nr:integrin alpha-PS1 isoform X2 [Photinus pyralis]